MSLAVKLSEAEEALDTLVSLGRIAFRFRRLHPTYVVFEDISDWIDVATAELEREVSELTRQVEDKKEEI